MIKERKVLGIIPARGGSKGLPGKNILPFGDEPLIAHTINQANKSKDIDEAHILYKISLCLPSLISLSNFGINKIINHCKPLEYNSIPY